MIRLLRLTFCALLGLPSAVSAALVFETTSAYHHIRVTDQSGIRTLNFDGAMQTRMALRNPLEGHFEYIDYFFMPWLWNDQITNVLVVGLGGGSAQRLFQRHCTNVSIDTVEIDPVVVEVAKKYFQFTNSHGQKVYVSDGRVFLRRAQTSYGAIMMDAYVHHRYGSAIPFQLATKEFFELARDRLTTNGVLAYNIIGLMRSNQPDLLGAIYKTMNSVFPHVYMFPAQTSQNVVLVATRTPQKLTAKELQQRAVPLIKSKRVTLPSFWGRLNSLRIDPPPNVARCDILTDDYAPVDGLLPAGN